MAAARFLLADDPGAGKSIMAGLLIKELLIRVALGALPDRGADGGELDTAVILTTAPNDLLRRVQDRMSVVIPNGLEEACLEAVKLEPESLNPGHHPVAAR